MELELPNGDTLEITSCPRRYVGIEVIRVLQLAHFARKGSWPAAGGTLDQSQQFLNAAELIWSENADYQHDQNPFALPED